MSTDHVQNQIQTFYFIQMELRNQVRHAVETENAGDCFTAEKLYLELLETNSTDPMLVGQCFSGLGRIALQQEKPREAFVFLQKAESLLDLSDVRSFFFLFFFFLWFSHFVCFKDKMLVDSTRASMRQCRAVLGEFSDSLSQHSDMFQFALRLAQFELQERHFVHCGLALQCAEKLSGGDVFLLDSVDCLRKKLARASGMPVGDLTGEQRVSEDQAMDVLYAIQREDLGSVWRRSWWPYMITMGVAVTVVAVVLGIRSLPEKEK